MEALLNRAIIYMREFMDKHDNSGHGSSHCEQVLRNAQMALCEFTLSENDRLAVQLAALLHDVDDSKLFSTTNYTNARRILKNLSVDIFLGDFISNDNDNDDIDNDNNDNSITSDIIDDNLVIEMIDLVSCSKNGNSLIEPRWKLIPRDADRIEALGVIGIKRCYQYNNARNVPLFVSTTPLLTSVEEIEKALDPTRLEKYIACGGKSDSMIDHYYDKLLHIGTLHSGSIYLQNLAQERRLIMMQFLAALSASFKYLQES